MRLNFWNISYLLKFIRISASTSGVFLLTVGIFRKTQLILFRSVALDYQLLFSRLSDESFTAFPGSDPR